MSDGKLRIIITDDTKSGNSAEEKVKEAQTPTAKQNKGDTAINNVGAYILYRTIENTAKSVANYAIANIGNFTGDYTAQRNINNALNMGGRVLAIGTMLATGNVAGAIISGVGMATSDILGMISETQANKKQNYEIEQLRKLSGLDQRTNGSR